MHGVCELTLSLSLYIYIYIHYSMVTWVDKWSNSYYWLAGFCWYSGQQQTCNQRPYQSIGSPGSSLDYLTTMLLWSEQYMYHLAVEGLTCHLQRALVILVTGAMHIKGSPVHACKVLSTFVCHVVTLWPGCHSFQKWVIVKLGSPSFFSYINSDIGNS